MKVFNLTDVETDVLKQRGLVAQGIAVGGRIVDPGEFADVEDTAKVRNDLSYLLSVGAVSLERLPPPYVQRRQQLAAEGGKLKPIPQQFLDVKETATVGEPAPGTMATEGEQATLAKNDPTVGADEAATEAPKNEPKKSGRR